MDFVLLLQWSFAKLGRLGTVSHCSICNYPQHLRLPHPNLIKGCKDQSPFRCKVLAALHRGIPFPARISPYGPCPYPCCEAPWPDSGQDFLDFHARVHDANSQCNTMQHYATLATTAWWIVFFLWCSGLPWKIKVLAFFPTCQVRASRFYRVTCSSSSSSSSSDLLRLLPTANSRSRWALPGLNRKLQISVGTLRSGRLWSGPGPRAQEAVEWPGPVPHTDLKTLWSGPGPERMSDRMPDRMPDRMAIYRMYGRYARQIYVQKECQNECRKEC